LQKQQNKYLVKVIQRLLM